MKLNKFFIAAAAATMLFSCAKEQGTEGPSKVAGEKAKLTIKVAATGTRAAGQNDGTGDMGIADYVAIVLDANGTVIASGVSASSADIADLETTTAAKKVLVISNLNDALTTSGALNSTITSAATLAQAIENAVDLSNGTTQSSPATLILGSTPNTNFVWSAGEADLTWTTLNTDGDAYVETVPVTIRPVVAKISLKVVVPAEYEADGGEYGGNFRFDSGEGIMLLNAVSKTKFFGAKAFESYTDAAYPWLVPTTKAYYSGMNIATGYANNNAASTVRDFLKDGFTGSTSGTSTTYYNYYVFENDADKAADHPTIVTLKGTWGRTLTDGDITYAGATQAEKDALIAALAPRTVYFPLNMTSLDAGANFTPAVGGEQSYGTGVQRGKCYNVTLKLTDAVFSGEYEFPTLPITEKPAVVPPVVPPGGGDPTDEVAKAFMTVTVTLVDWIPMEIGKEW